MTEVQQTIVVAVDHSVEAENTVKFYAEKLHRPGNKVLLIHCVELPELTLENARDCHMSPGVLANMWKEEEAKSKILEEKMKIILKAKGIPGRLKTCSGKPGEMICDIAQQEKAVIMLTGARGMGKLRRTILGSVSDYLVKHAHCPVVICRDPADVERRRHFSMDSRMRRASGDKLRHASGGEKGRRDSLSAFAANLRRRFASGGSSVHGGRSYSVDVVDTGKENRYEQLTMISTPKTTEEEKEEVFQE